MLAVYVALHFIFHYNLLMVLLMPGVVHAGGCDGESTTMPKIQLDCRKRGQKTPLTVSEPV